MSPIVAAAGGEPVDRSMELNDVLSGLTAFLQAEVFPLHRDHGDILDDPRRRYRPDGSLSDEALALIRQVRQASAEAGYYLMTLPESIGGADIGWEGLFLVWEHIFFQCGSLLWLGHHVVAHWTKGPNPLLAELSPSVRDRYLADLGAGTTSMCFAMSEPDAGSDGWMMQTGAVPTNGGWTLNGTKQWISNGAHADLAIVFAVTDRHAARERRGGISAFVVPTSTPGFEVGGVTPMFGQLGSNESVLHLSDVFVPDDHVLGQPGRGFSLAMSGVALGRLYNCAKVVGLARWALVQAVNYAGERRAFGVPLSSHQALAFTLADRVMEVRAARLVALDSARRLDEGSPARHELAAAKVQTTEAAVAAIDSAIQIHGASGFTNELGLVEAWAIARAARVADGTGEILRRQVARALVAGDWSP
jgi:acyl-CoA dehydrogenase